MSNKTEIIFGTIAVDLDYINAEQLSECLQNSVLSNFSKKQGTSKSPMPNNNNSSLW